jgi:hypothetical protein
MIFGQGIVPEKGTAVSLNLQNVSEEPIDHCSVCGRITKLVELPERIDSFALRAAQT